MTADCYVYYRIHSAQITQARHAVAAHFEALKKCTGVSGRLARRRDDPHTWMEIYERIPDITVFEQELRASAEQHGLDKLVVANSVRTIEIFIADVLLPEGASAIHGNNNTQCA